MKLEKKTWQSIGGICYAGLIILFADSLIRLFSNFSFSIGFIISLLRYVGFILIAVGLFAEKPGFITAGSVLNVLNSINAIINNARVYISAHAYGDTDNERILLCFLLASLLLALYYIFVAIASQTPSNAKTFGCAAAGIGLLSTVVRLIPSIQSGSVAWGGSTILYPILLFLGAVALGMALCQIPSPKVQAVPASSGVTNNLEKLSNLKKLLDNGAITQEEFEEKKRQILGL